MYTPPSKDVMMGAHRQAIRIKITVESLPTLRLFDEDAFLFINCEYCSGRI